MAVSPLQHPAFGMTKYLTMVDREWGEIRRTPHARNRDVGVEERVILRAVYSWRRSPIARRAEC